MHSEITMVFNRVYDETYDDIMRFVLSRTCDSHATSDILQDVYKSLYIRFRNKGTEDILDYKGFLITSASNALKKHYLTLKVERETISFESEDINLQALELELSAELTGVDEQVAMKELAEQVLAFLDEKGKAVKELFVLHFFCGMTIKEASESAGIPQTTAVNAIYRSIKEMKIKFEL